jgi:hypothetical protein
MWNPGIIPVVLVATSVATSTTGMAQCSTQD